MSVLSVCQNAAKLLNLGTPPTTMFNTSVVNSKRLLEAYVLAGKNRSRQYDWPQLTRTHTITLVSGQDTYDVPSDFLAIANNTQYDVSGARPMEGPLNSQQWAQLQYGITNVGPYMKFRIAGRTSKRFQINPTPSASGGELAFIYRSNTWVAPADWVTGTSYLSGVYVSNTDGNIYIATNGGTSGATEPTHTTGTASDGGVTWQYVSDSYTRPLADTDVSLLDEDLMEQDVIWLMRKFTGMDYVQFQADADMAWAQHYAHITGAPILNLGSLSDDEWLISYQNVPDTGFGL